MRIGGAGLHLNVRRQEAPIGVDPWRAFPQVNIRSSSDVASCDLCSELLSSLLSPFGS